MKTLLPPFAALVTRYQSDTFWRVRLKLTGTYVVIVAVILSGFSLFLLVQVEQQLGALKSTGTEANTITKEAAMRIAERTVPGSTASDVEYELLEGQLVHVVELQTDMEEVDIYIDRNNGTVIAVDDEADSVESFTDVLINDLQENLLLANSVILFAVTLFGYWFAGQTLRPVQMYTQRQEQFSNNVAHEIRTPLSAMLAAVESVLRKDESTQTYKDVLSDFKQETKRLIQLSEDLLLTARGEQTNSLTPVSLPTVVQNAVRRLQPLAQQKQITIATDIATTTTIAGNQTMLERLVENILENAIKFSHPQSAVRATLTANQLAITDTGIGMSRETQKRIFERFYTQDEARDERQGGRGLGLAIVRQIADLHNATVSVASEPGNGTCVKVTFLQ